MAVVMLLGLVVGNFVYQAIADRDWWTAFERSWFQVIAGGLVLCAVR